MIHCCNRLCAGIMGYGCGFRSFLRELRMEVLHVPTCLESKAQKIKAAIQSKLQVNVTKPAQMRLIIIILISKSTKNMKYASYTIRKCILVCCHDISAVFIMALCRLHVFMCVF